MKILAIFFLVCSARALPLSQAEIRNSISAKRGMDRILEINEDMNYFQGDIVIPKNADNLNVILDESMKWDFKIPYKIEDHFPFEIKEKIEDVLNEFTVRTCLQFVKRGNEDSYLTYTQGSGCYASVGRLGGSQDVSIGIGCESSGVIKHETLHALGFWHEQSRYDRDDHVEIKWENIEPGKEHNFEKYTQEQIQTFGQAYDYNSLMHYGPTAFSSNGEATIVPLGTGAQSMGQRSDFSDIDLNKLRQLYKCDTKPQGWTEWTAWSSGCDINCEQHRKRYCEGDGCQEESQTEIVVCERCEIGHDPDCGDVILTGPTGMITSPMYPHNYKADVECVQTILVAPDQQIRLEFQVMDVEDYSGICYYDWVKIFDGPNEVTNPLGTYCGTTIPTTITSSGNSLTVLFFSDYSITKRGFMANYFTTSKFAPLHTCTFEGGICGWTNDVNDDFNWLRNSGPTPSDGTGPSVDHTTSQNEGYYMYIETSSPQTNGMKALIKTPVIQQSPAKGHCLQFSYNMYGKDADTLNVFMTSGNFTFPVPIFSESGNLGNDDWVTTHVDICGLINEYQLTFEGHRGGGWQGDIAFDDVSIYGMTCDDVIGLDEGSGIVIGGY